MEKEMLEQLENLNKEYEKLKDNNDYLKNIVANREEDINILYDNFKFSNLFLEDSIDKNVMFLFSKYLIANTCMVQIYNLTNDLHKNTADLSSNKELCDFYGEWSKIAKAPYPLYCDREYTVNKRIYHDYKSIDKNKFDETKGLYSCYFKLNDYSLKIASDLGYRLDSRDFNAPLKAIEIKQLITETNDFIKALTNYKEHGFNFTLREEFHRNDLSYLILDYDKNNELEIIKYNTNHIQDLRYLNSHVLDAINDTVKAYYRTKSDSEYILNKAYKMITEYNKDEENIDKFDTYKFVNYDYTDRDKFMNDLNNNIISTVQPYMFGYSSLDSFRDSVHDYWEIANKIQNSFFDFLSEKDRKLEEEANKNAYDMEIN